jgi:hypothetical protein
LSTAPNVPAVPDGNKGFETKARTASPLGFVVVVEVVPVVVEGLETLPLQETKTRLTTRRTTQASAILFKPETPKSMKDKDLDAKHRIIAEP